MLQITKITLENNPELFAVFDDAAINYISHNSDTITDEELQEIIRKEKLKE